MKILIVGGTGLVGSRLVNSLISQNHHVIILSRNPSKYQNKFDQKVDFVDWNANEVKLLQNTDVVIKLSGENVAQFWTRNVKNKILSSRVDLSQILLQFLKRNQVKSSLLINASAIGFYAKKDMIYDGQVDENSRSGDSFLSTVCQLNEESCKIFSEAGMRVVHLRIGMILTSNFSLLIGFLSFFSLPMLGIKKNYFPWVHIDDVVGFINHTIINHVEGPFNLISPKPINHKDFYHTIRKHYNGIFPWILFIPSFIVKMAGDISEIVLYGPKTVPVRTLERGYKFKFPDLDEALHHIDK